MDLIHPAGGSDGKLDAERTVQILREALQTRSGPAELGQVSLDREAAAAFIADHATFLSSIAEQAGFPKARILCDVLYVSVFGEAAPT